MAPSMAVVSAAAPGRAAAAPRARVAATRAARRMGSVAVPGGLGCSIAIRRAGRNSTLVRAEASPNKLKELLYPDGNDTTSPKGWAMMSKHLAESKSFKSITPDEAEAMMETGAKIIDVRPAEAFEDSNIEGSFNAPMYQPITGWDAKKTARRAAFALFGVLNGTEENPNFFADVEKVAGKSDKIVLLCGEAGTLTPSETKPMGKQSRSLIAAYALLKSGYTEVYHMNRGFYYLDLEE